MKLFENLVKDLDQEEKTQLIDILKKSVISEEMVSLEEQLKTAKLHQNTAKLPQRFAINQRMSDLNNRLTGLILCGLSVITFISYFFMKNKLIVDIFNINAIYEPVQGEPVQAFNRNSSASSTYEYYVLRDPVAFAQDQMILLLIASGVLFLISLVLIFKKENEK